MRGSEKAHMQVTPKEGREGALRTPEGRVCQTEGTASANARRQNEHGCFRDGKRPAWLEKRVKGRGWGRRSDDAGPCELRRELEDGFSEPWGSDSAREWCGLGRGPKGPLWLSVQRTFLEVLDGGFCATVDEQ